MLPMNYRLSRPGLRYEEEKTFCLKSNQKYVPDHSRIIFIINKSNLHLNWCRVFEPFKAHQVFPHSVPINHAQRMQMFQMISRINRKYLSEQFQVTGLCNNYTLSLLWGRENNFQNWTVTLPLPSISWHIDLLNAPTEPVVISSGFLCLLGIVLVGTGLPTVAAVPAQINWYIKK